jgi:hypothetical protein
MRLFGKALFVLIAFAGLGILAAPGLAAELKAEVTEPGISIVVTDLKRDESNSVTLRFQLVNESGKAFHPGCKWREASNRPCEEVGGVHLIDNANKKKYLVVRDSAGKCACSTVQQVKAGARSNMWAK